MPKETYGLAALAAALLSGVFLVTYSGPYRFVADLQVAWFHTNIVNISFLVTLALIAAPLMGVVYALERRFGTRQTWFTPIWSNLDRVLDLPPGKLLMVGLTLLVMGGFFFVKDLGRGPLVALSVRDLEDGHPPQGTYVDLTDGNVIEDANIEFRSNSTTYRYLPVIDHAQQPVLFLRVSERQPLRDGEGHIRGILDLNGMEGELQSQLQASHAIGETHYILGVGRKPAPEVGAWMTAIGFVLFVAGLFWWRTRYVEPTRPPV